MSAGGFSDPRLKRIDPRDFHSQHLAGALQSGRPLLGAGLLGTHSFSGVTLSARRNLARAASSRPFKVTSAAPPAGHDGEHGWVQVALYSMLSASADPTDKVTITGLGKAGAFQLDIDSNPRQYIWLDVDITHLFDSTPGPATASMDNGLTWNGDSGDFWPDPVSFNTDDGTATGSSDTAPDSRIQNHIYVPVAWTYDKNDPPWGSDYDPPGIMLSSSVKLLQVLDTHLRIYDDCYNGEAVKLCMPWTAPWADS